MFFKHLLRTALFLFCHVCMASEVYFNSSPQLDKLRSFTKPQSHQKDTRFWHTTFYDGYLPRAEKLKRAEEYKKNRLQEYESFIRIIEEARYGDRFKGKSKIQEIVSQCLLTFHNKINSLEQKYTLFIKELPEDDSTPKKKVTFGKFYSETMELPMEAGVSSKDYYALFIKAQPYETFARFVDAYPPVKPASLMEATETFSIHSSQILQAANLCLKENGIEKDNKLAKGFLKQIKEMQKSLERYQSEDRTLLNFFETHHKKWYSRVSQEGKLAAITLKYEWTRSHSPNLGQQESGEDKAPGLPLTAPPPSTNKTHSTSNVTPQPTHIADLSPSTSPPSSPTQSLDGYFKHLQKVTQKKTGEKEIIPREKATNS